jgi:hypothetical protein
VEEQRRSLDENGLRYLTSLRSFYILNERATSMSKVDTVTGRMSKELVARERMRYRDFVWAYHSESQEILLDAAVANTGKKLIWNDARALGLFVWIKSHERLVCLHYFVSSRPLAQSLCREPKRKKSLEISICTTTCAIRQLVRCFTSH